MSWFDEYMREENNKDREDLSQLEEQLRCERDPRRRRSLENDINIIVQRIHQRQLRYQQIHEGSSVSPWVIFYFAKNKINYFIRLVPNFIKIIVLILILIIFSLSLNQIFNPKKTLEPINVTSDQNNNDADIKKHMSYGEKTLFSGGIINSKQEGMKNYSAGNFGGAADEFDKARTKQPHDPETLIYLNNANLNSNTNIEFDTIAVIIPVTNLEVSLDILRGVAQVQDSFNKENKKFNKGLKILIVNDGNDINRAKAVARYLVKQDILAVIGHYTSDATLEASKIYEAEKLVYISPGTTYTKLSRNTNYNFFYRTVPPLSKYTSALASFLREKRYKKFVIFYNRKSIYSDDFNSNIDESLSSTGIEKINKGFDDKYFLLSDPLFQANISIEKFKNKNDVAFIVIPDGGTSIYSLPNAIKLIKANRGEHLILGSNTLSSIDTLLIGNDAKNLFISIYQSETILPNSPFVKEFKSLWNIREISERTVVAYDAAKALATALPKVASSNKLMLKRQKLHETLPKIEIEGANKEKFKFSNGERTQVSVGDKFEIAKVVELYECSAYGYIFVPEKYTSGQVDNLKKDCQH
ncbi:ABC transporter substrate-binding protein [Nostoc sp. ChiQUE01b]|uniref:ABC transporter substrate-binding protein n=1 Tax=Nostoc sp. ChiQUE01b TaxID=3075376 RepID=UPI002AD5A1AB|nr:ABC transporter substrate-binding protein [Nostoc sp. ChiQUE01b]MDZ8260616.1 ABC transporter substrate-binding protein [Nostoc sp. ChiQUE01b]